MQKVTSRGLSRTMGREIWALGKVEEGAIIRLQGHAVFEPQVCRPLGIMGALPVQTHTHTHSCKKTRLLQSILSKKRAL